ncbi:MAG: hypothetical protein H6835_01770 [Planctomycetes bacterium]|nr:hypothetical protein [Planctomycetota bacterium]
MRVGRAVALVVPLLLAALVAAQEPEVARTEARQKEAAQRALDKISAVVEGRCVDGATGEPLPGVTVELHAWGGRRDDAPNELLRPEAVTTEADGKFSIRVFARDDYQVGFDASIEGRWPRTGRWRNLPAGQVEQVGDVKLYPGVRAVGKVVDEQGEPVPDVSVGIDDLPLFLGSEEAPRGPRRGGIQIGARAEPLGRAMHFAANGVRWSHSKGDGTFESREALPAGTFEVRINNQEITLVEPAEITIPEHGPMQPLTIVVRQVPYLAGVVVDDTGAPVKGVALQAVLNRSGRMASAWTRDDGTFRIYRVENCPDEVAIQVDDPGPCERAALPDRHTWGKHDIRIELRRALTVELRVVVAGTGEPVEQFAVRSFPTGGLAMMSSDRRLGRSGEHPGGVLQVPGIARGGARIGVVAKDPTLRYAEIEIDARDGMAPLRVELERMVPMMVQVLDDKGLPLAKATVGVLEQGNRDEHRSYNDPRSDSLSIFSSDLTARFDELLHQAVTDEGGQCIVYGLDGRSDLVLIVRQDRDERARVTDVSFGKQHASRQIQLEAK